ncbi:radical SAM protein [Candidatus Roizmanbacteria bacterium CG09_land_8_20_14_0_10_41_9]|uniref:Radical SAM protein n=1 Tax=Candidatus Roizmanbacteria bacterium CG09_land_8_20_14_0_10_41_9 TaxID=1974850 RepID=A0A2H0WT42_9BACT|nr:MAG: radical SAM protein [Candidatus Roizmanbacteria bacterium CG09_land_8_20_14_0_10_41_9]
MTSKINTTKAKSIFIKSGLPGSDRVINPYNGCLFGCMYCYAAQIARWKHPNEEWGTYIDVKVNAPELLKIELEKLNKKLKTKNFGSVFFSSVTDPYVSIEAKYKLTRKCLEVLADFGYEGTITIQTKSPLATRDIDILKRFKKVSVGFTITSLDDDVSRFLEVNAPSVSLRLKALMELHKEGIDTYAFVGPILPYFLNKERINPLLDKLQAVGVKEVWFEHINLSPKIKARLYQYLKKEDPTLISEFEKADTEEYRSELNKMIHTAMRERGLKMGLGKVIYHKNPLKK